MQTAELKSHLHKLIDGISDNSVLQAVHTLLSKAAVSGDWWDELSEEDRKAIEIGLEQANNGELISHKQVMTEVDKLLVRM